MYFIPHDILIQNIEVDIQTFRLDNNHYFMQILSNMFVSTKLNITGLCKGVEFIVHPFAEHSTSLVKEREKSVYY